MAITLVKSWLQLSLRLRLWLLLAAETVVTAAIDVAAVAIAACC
jgi:hypothetical protein